MKRLALALLVALAATGCMHFSPLPQSAMEPGKDLGHVRFRLGGRSVEMTDARVVPGGIEGRPTTGVEVDHVVRVVDWERGRVHVPDEFVGGPVEREDGHAARAAIGGTVIGLGTAAVVTGAVFFAVFATIQPVAMYGGGPTKTSP